MTTNMSESTNSMLEKARDGTWLDCMGIIPTTMLRRICQLRDDHRGKAGVVEHMKHVLQKRWDNCAGFDVLEIEEDRNLFTVIRNARGASEEERKYNIDVRQHKCNCGEWQEHDVPCIDAMAYYRHTEKRSLAYIMENLVTFHYKYETEHELLKSNIVPVCLSQISADGVTLPPNDMKRTTGRPPMKRLRKRSRWAHDPEQSDRRCKKCNQKGHNIRTCDERRRRQNAELNNLDLS